MTRECTNCGRSFQDKLSHCPFDGSLLVRSQEPRPDHYLGRDLDGKYFIEQKLGEGGMCDIYRAVGVSDNHPFAVKILHENLAADADSIKRFKNEVQTAGLIKHPNVVALLDSGETSDGVFYMVMEYVGGITLKQALKSQGRFRLPRLNNIVKQICSALDAAHAQGVIHRDLKPDNIMLRKDSDTETEEVKVLDFGIAKLHAGDLAAAADDTPTHIVMGTPRYMSPEQCEGRTIDTRSDIYSLGLIIYEMIVGEPPFTDSSARVLMNKHSQEQVPSLRRARPGLPAAVERAVLHALEKSPLKRPQSARELAEELDAAVHTDPSNPSLSPEQPQPSVKSNLVPVVKQVSGSVSIVEYVNKPASQERPKTVNKLLHTSGQIKTHFKKRWTHWLIGLIVLLLITIVALFFLIITSDPHQPG